MLIIGIPAFDEAPTVGLVLWRLRELFQAHPREYEVLVIDDGSTDATAEVLRAYTRVMPVTILKHGERRGYAATLDALVRTASSRTRYPRRDALVLMQADLTDVPEQLPALTKAFDGGADLVVAEGTPTRGTPTPVRRLKWIAPWLLRPAARVAGVRDPLGTMRVVRLSVVREAIKRAGEKPLTAAPGWAANAELLASLAPFARRIETVPVEPRYDLRARPTRIRALSGARELFRYARARRATGVS